jgi:hypothetical protein
MNLLKHVILLLNLVILASCIQKQPNLGLASLKDGRSRAVSSHAPANSNADRLKYIQLGEIGGSDCLN